MSNIQIKSVFEKISTEVFNTKDFKTTKQHTITYVESTQINEKDKKIILKNLQNATTTYGLQKYICNSLLQYEGLGMNQFKHVSTTTLDEIKDEI